jgi:hypothetical protein
MEIKDAITERIGLVIVSQTFSGTGKVSRD